MLNLENDQTLLEPARELIDKLNEALNVVAEGEGVDYEPEVSLYLVDNQAIQELNRDYRSLDTATDVLSFPVLAFEEGAVFSEQYTEHDLTDDLFLDDRLLLGDVIISTERAISQAVDYGHSIQREMVFLFVHSLLHLLGYDHMNAADRERMVAREQHYMALIGVSRS
ncbi:rRNA maturation RNase YbeY [Proteiniclasticum sp. QWL-01]|uniref:rRNA maturation RNase YbeY n=1 Tax=Proteiniclasticum sp. QWL-01 TaxID=3036945 RepID=UPI002204853A|nr:rRNA maturation RNase YbeY [Proteiniclasticum sp. QWL-01]UUM12577.1 rRNA maturation RNase YbeY [Clostridiaceae bacterium HFYG-1003]WFF74133.1 rRNA maturation RNase YbeY [Proteiniclasticum sp. QWL-01]